MEQKKEKPYQRIFIDYVNSEFDRTDIFELIDRIAEYFDFDRGLYHLNRIKSKLDKKLLDDYKPQKPALVKKWKRYLELADKRYETGNKASKEELQLKQFFKKEKRSIHDFRDRHLKSLKRFFRDLKTSQRELRLCLEKVVTNQKLEKDFLNIIRKYNDSIGTFFYCPRGKTYLGKIKSIHNDNTRDVIRFTDDTKLHNFVPMILKPIIYYDLAEFLCTEDWKKLIQCKNCKKFLIAKRVTRQFCENDDKCHNAYHNKKM